jgi:hypothetical protein
MCVRRPQVDAGTRLRLTSAEAAGCVDCGAEDRELPPNDIFEVPQRLFSRPISTGHNHAREILSSTNRLLGVKHEAGAVN